MHLYYTPNSPFARKVRIVAIEKGILDQITLILCPPSENRPELLAANPLGKIPALALENGDTVFDSPVICEYLDNLSSKNRLIPEHGKERLTVRKTEALADGLMDALVARYLEFMRPEEQRSPIWIGRWENAISRTLESLENGAFPLPSGIDLGAISLAAALDYINIRYDLKWKESHAKTARWLDKFKERESMKLTTPEMT